VLYDEPDDTSPEEPLIRPFPFLRLPAELRNRIYDHIDRDISDDYRCGKLDFYHDQGHFARRCRRSCFGLTLVCQQIRNEVLPLFSPIIPPNAHVEISFDDLGAFLAAIFPSYGPTKTPMTRVSIKVTRDNAAALREHDVLPLLTAKAFNRSVKWEYEPATLVCRYSFSRGPGTMNESYYQYGLSSSHERLRQACDLLNKVIIFPVRGFLYDIRSGLFLGFHLCRRNSSGRSSQEPLPKPQEWDWKLTVQNQHEIIDQDTECSLASYSRTLALSSYELRKLELFPQSIKNPNSGASECTVKRFPYGPVLKELVGVQISVFNVEGSFMEKLAWHTSAPYSLSDTFLRCSCSFPNTCQPECKWFWVARQWWKYNAMSQFVGGDCKADSERQELSAR
jgi:hypothetical protein